MPSRGSVRYLIMASTCGICLEQSPFRKRVHPDACQHRFCLLCIEKWTTCDDRCPICRQVYAKLVGLGGLLQVTVEDVRARLGDVITPDSDSDSDSVWASESEWDSQEQDDDDSDFDDLLVSDAEESDYSADSGTESGSGEEVDIPAQEIEALESNALSVLGGGACIYKPQSSIGKALLRRKGRRTRARTCDTLTLYEEYSDHTREKKATFQGTDVSTVLLYIEAMRKAEAADDYWELAPVHVSDEEHEEDRSEPPPAMWEYAPKRPKGMGVSGNKYVLRYSIILNE